MKKKLISLTLAAALCASMFVGCGNEGKNAVSTETTKSSETAVTTESKVEDEKEPEITNISVYYYGTNDQPAQKAVIEAMNEYSAEKIGVTISFMGIASSEYRDKTSMALASKEDVDLVWTAEGYGLPIWSRDGALMDITDLVPKYEGIMNTIPESFWEAAKVDGKVYFIPNYKETGVGNSLITPKSVADEIKAKYGIDFIELDCSSVWDYANLEAYILAAIDLGVDMPLPTGMSFNYAIQSDATYEKLTMPFVVNKETGKVELMYEIPEFRDYIELMISWKEKGIWKEEQVMADYKAKNYWYQTDSWALCNDATTPDMVNNMINRYGIDVYVKPITSNYVSTQAVTGSGWAITAYSEKADACLKWLELVNTDTAFADMWVYGVEGTHYTREANGTITKIADSGWSNGAWKATNTWVLSLLSTEAADKKEQYTAFNESAVLSDMFGFRANTDSIATEMAAVSAVHSELKYMLQYGFYDIEKLDEVIANCKAAGSDTIIAELQKQVDAYLANK